MTDTASSQTETCYDEIKRTLETVLIKLGLSKPVAHDASCAQITALRQHLNGETVYFSKFMTTGERNTRKAAFRAEYNGLNFKGLVKKYQISERTAFRYLAEAKEKAS